MRNLPGALRNAKIGEMCDEHGDRQAVKRLQGETDSMGCEYHYLCQECYDKYLEEKKKPTTAQCDWCGTDNVEVRPHRDWEEGSNGPVYYLCIECIRKNNASLNEMADNSADDIDDTP